VHCPHINIDQGDLLYVGKHTSIIPWLSNSHKNRIFTAFRLISELGELAEIEGGPSGGAAAVPELEEGKVEVVAAPVVLLGIDERGSGGERRPCVTLVA
jgi:hypothetical protein